MSNLSVPGIAYPKNQDDGQIEEPYIPTVHAITTIEANFYWHHVINGSSRYGFRPVSSIAGGKVIRNGIRINNSTAVDVNIQVNVDSLSTGKKATVLNIPLLVNDLANLTGKTIRVTCVGDSLTSSGDPANRMATLATANGFTILGAGTQGSGQKHEGRSGWSYGMFNNSTSASPFYNGGVLDWGNYFTTVGSTPDVVVWALGTNDVFNACNQSTLDGAVSAAQSLANSSAVHAQTLINGLIAYNSGISNLILLPGVGSNGPTGFGVNYGIASSWNYYHAAIQKYRKTLSSYFVNREVEGIFVGELGAMVDPDYGASLTSTTISAYNAGTVTESNNGVHHGTAGYVEMAGSMLASVSSAYLNKPIARVMTFGKNTPYNRTWYYDAGTLTEYAGSSFSPSGGGGDYQNDARGGLVVSTNSGLKIGMLTTTPIYWKDNPNLIPAHNSMLQASIHPSMNYFALAGNTSPFFYMFKKASDGTWSLVDPGITLTSALYYCIAFSNDGTRFALGGGVTPTKVYRFNEGILSDEVALSGNFNTNTGLSWRYDDSALCIAQATIPYINVFSRVGDVYTRIDSSSTAGTTWARHAHFSPDGTKIAAVHNNAVSLTWYDYDGTTVVPRTNPADMPSSVSAYGVQWVDNTRLIVGTNSAPYLVSYTVTGGLLVKDPEIVPLTPITSAISTIRRFQ